MIPLANSYAELQLSAISSFCRAETDGSPTVSADGQKATLSMAVVVSMVDVLYF